MCSNHLPLYLTPSTRESDEGVVAASAAGGVVSSPSPGLRPPVVQIRACGSVCREVERQCPFFILNTEEDKAAGNPSFICKGKDLTVRGNFGRTRGL